MYSRMFVCNDIEKLIGMLAQQKCKPCSALDFKCVGNKMAMIDNIF